MWVARKCTQLLPKNTRKCTNLSQVYRKCIQADFKYSQLTRNPYSHLIASAWGLAHFPVPCHLYFPNHPHIAFWFRSCFAEFLLIYFRWSELAKCGALQSGVGTCSKVLRVSAWSPCSTSFQVCKRARKRPHRLSSACWFVGLSRRSCVSRCWRHSESVRGERYHITPENLKWTTSW